MVLIPALSQHTKFDHTNESCGSKPPSPLPTAWHEIYHSGTERSTSVGKSHMRGPEMSFRFEVLMSVSYMVTLHKKAECISRRTTLQHLEG